MDKKERQEKIDELNFQFDTVNLRTKIKRAERDSERNWSLADIYLMWNIIGLAALLAFMGLLTILVIRFTG